MSSQKNVLEVILSSTQSVFNIQSLKIGILRFLILISRN